MLGTTAIKYFFKLQWNEQHGVKWHLRVPLPELANPPFCYKLGVSAIHYYRPLCTCENRSLHQAPVIQWLSRATGPTQTWTETVISLFSIARCVLLLSYVCMLHAQSGSFFLISGTSVPFLEGTHLTSHLTNIKLLIFLFGNSTFVLY